MNRSSSQTDALLQALLDQTSDAYYLIDPEDRFVDVNGRACDSLGYTRDELLSMHVWDVETTLSEDEARHYRETLAPGETFSREGVHRRKDGSEFQVDARSSVLMLDGIRYRIVLARDITRSVRGESEEEALRKVREKIWAMRTVRDQGEVLTSVGSSLLALGVPFDQCGINVVEKDGVSYLSHCHNMKRSGEWELVKERSGSLPQIWMNGRTVYRTDIHENDSLGRAFWSGNCLWQHSSINTGCALLSRHVGRQFLRAQGLLQP